MTDYKNITYPSTGGTLQSVYRSVTNGIEIYIYISKEPKKDKREEDVEEDEIGEDKKILFINLEEEAWRREKLNIRMRTKEIEEPEKGMSQEY